MGIVSEYMYDFGPIPHDEYITTIETMKNKSSNIVTKTGLERSRIGPFASMVCWLDHFLLMLTTLFLNIDTHTYFFEVFEKSKKLDAFSKHIIIQPISHLPPHYSLFYLFFLSLVLSLVAHSYSISFILNFFLITRVPFTSKSSLLSFTIFYFSSFIITNHIMTCFFLSGNLLDFKF